MTRAKVGIVLILSALAACRTADPGATASQTTSTTPSAPASVPPGPASPPRETVALWAPLRWDMGREAAAVALRAAGYVVTDRGPTKTPASMLSAEVGPAHAHLVAYFDDKGVMNQIVLTTESLPEQDAHALRAKLDARFGAASEDRRSIEKRWKLAGDAHITARVAQDGSTYVVHQERGRGAAQGAVGWGDLSWGANVTETAAKLTAAGFATKTRRSKGVDPCTLPNAPPNCSPEKATELELTKTEGAVTITGHVAILAVGGLSQVVIDKRGFVAHAPALGELAAIEKASGLAASTLRGQRTVWRPGTGEVTLDLEQRDGRWSAIEAYRPTTK